MTAIATISSTAMPPPEWCRLTAVGGTADEDRADDDTPDGRDDPDDPNDCGTPGRDDPDDCDTPGRDDPDDGAPDDEAAVATRPTALQAP